jgi:hypothetical protein
MSNVKIPMSIEGVEGGKVEGGMFDVQREYVRGYLLFPASYFLAIPSTLPPYTFPPIRGVSN